MLPSPDETSFILPITKAVLAMVFSYLIGSIPTGLIVARFVAGIDIREHGSFNIGLTNVVRTVGWGPGLVTGVFDFLKGYLPVLITIKIISPDDFPGVPLVYEMIILMVAAAVLLGNMFPVYISFQGGKGVATGLGIMSALLGVFIFIPIAVFGIVLFVFRFVSLASICSVLSVPLTVLFLASHLPFIRMQESTTAGSMLSAFTWAVAILVVWRHKKNISRILAGTEPRVRRPREPEVLSLSEKLARDKAKQEAVASETAAGSEKVEVESSEAADRD